MFIPNEKLVFYIFFLYETTIVFSSGVDQQILDERNEYRIELEKTFGHPFYNLTEFNDVLVWKISAGGKTFKPQDYSGGFTEFERNETFLIFTQNWRFRLTLYYWVGTETTLEEKKNVAKCAAIFFILMEKYCSIIGAVLSFAREDQMFESESFIHTLNRLRRIPKPEDGRIGVYRDVHVPLNGPNVYLMKEGQTRESIKIPLGLGLQLLSHNTCIIVEAPPQLEMLFPVINYCADSVDEMVRWRAHSFVRCICTTVNKFTVPLFVTKRCNKFKAMVELFENREYYRASETDYLKDGNKIILDQEEEILLFKFSVVNFDEQQTMVREAVIQTPTDIGVIENHRNYILDSKSIAGIFFVYGEETSADVLLWAIQDAEEYLHATILLLSRPIRMRIISADSNKFPIDFVINALLPSQHPKSDMMYDYMEDNQIFDQWANYFL